MPTFERRKNKALGTRVIRKKGKGLAQSPYIGNYNVSGTSLKIVNSRLRRRLIKYTTELAKKPNSLIVEWGCGDATALFELAKKFPNTKFLGASQESHQNWQKKPENVVLVQTTSEAIAKLAGRKGSSKKVDLIYTHFGLKHLFYKDKSKKALRELENHLIKLKNSLKIGGKIIIRPLELKIPQKEFEEIVSNLKKAGFLVEITTGFKGEVLGISELTRIK